MEEWKLMVGNQLQAKGSYTELKPEYERLIKIYDNVVLERVSKCQF
jgi:hypothetical protein